MEKMRKKESAPKESGFFDRLRDRLSHMLGRKKEIQEPERKIEPIEPESTKVKREISPAEIIELRPSQIKLKFNPKERYQKKAERRAKRREEKRKAKLKQSRKNVAKNGLRLLEDDVDLFATFAGEQASKSEPEINFDEMLGQNLSAEDVQEIIAEKEAGLAENKPLSLSEVIRDYPIKPQRKLDLHRLKAQEALMKIDSFIRMAHQMGLRTVEIVTGKGIHSKEGKSALRDVTEEKIVELKRQGLILHFKWERIRKNRSGSMIVYLK